MADQKTMQKPDSYFHLHLVSDATGETLIAAARAVSSQFHGNLPVEHVYPLIRTNEQLQHVLEAIEKEPGIVLFTIVDRELNSQLLKFCKKLDLPCVNVLKPMFGAFADYLGQKIDRKVGAQHNLDRNYFKRIDALDFTMAHDDGALPDDIEEADIVLIGISRTSKTPTSIYLANRGIKTINVPLVPGMKIDRAIINARKPLIVALIASADQIFHIRQNRQLGLDPLKHHDTYTDRATIAEELAFTRQLCNANGWDAIDVSRRSIEETAATIIELHSKHLTKLLQL